MAGTVAANSLGEALAGRPAPPAWAGVATINDRRFSCAYCATFVGPHQGYYTSGPERIYICPSCGQPSYFSATGAQMPPPPFGSQVQHLPDDVQRVYAEARSCIAVGACTATALLCRKLLMNVAVAKGATPGKHFTVYVDFIEAQHLVPPGSKAWLDDIRDKGNEATHEIPAVARADAEEILSFVEILLKFVFEMPAQMAAKAAAARPTL
jgi:hypothetical protein